MPNYQDEHPECFYPGMLWSSTTPGNELQCVATPALIYPAGHTNDPRNKICFDYANINSVNNQKGFSKNCQPYDRDGNVLPGYRGGCCSGNAWPEGAVNDGLTEQSSGGDPPECRRHGVLWTIFKPFKPRRCVAIPVPSWLAPNVAGYRHSTTHCWHMCAYQKGKFCSHCRVAESGYQGACCSTGNRYMGTKQSSASPKPDKAEKACTLSGVQWPYGVDDNGNPKKGTYDDKYEKEEGNWHCVASPVPPVYHLSDSNEKEAEFSDDCERQGNCGDGFCEECLVSYPGYRGACCKFGNNYPLGQNGNSEPECQVDGLLWERDYTNTKSKSGKKCVGFPQPAWVEDELWKENPKHVWTGGSKNINDCWTACGGDNSARGFCSKCHTRDAKNYRGACCDASKYPKGTYDPDKDMSDQDPVECSQEGILWDIFQAQEGHRCVAVPIDPIATLPEFNFYEEYSKGEITKITLDDDTNWHILEDFPTIPVNVRCPFGWDKIYAWFGWGSEPDPALGTPLAGEPNPHKIIAEAFEVCGPYAQTQETSCIQNMVRYHNTETSNFATTLANKNRPNFSPWDCASACAGDQPPGGDFTYFGFSRSATQDCTESDGYHVKVRNCCRCIFYRDIGSGAPGCAKTHSGIAQILTGTGGCSSSSSSCGPNGKQGSHQFDDSSLTNGKRFQRGLCRKADGDFSKAKTDKNEDYCWTDAPHGFNSWAAEPAPPPPPAPPVYSYWGNPWWWWSWSCR
ncbi:unnamed protein product [Amoebophrya sp. A25]|nr:unnamed protein product [Amoebophrya sp. A25]|eukprot:GSA25T00006671001.1